VVAGEGAQRSARTLRRREPKQESQTVIKVGSDFYIHASSQNSRRATRVLVNGESFAVFDLGGDILETPDEPLGFFHRDTRHLGRFELKIAGETPHYLNSYTSRENAQLRINLSNPDLSIDGAEIKLRRNSIQIERNWVIAGAAIFHKAIVRNLEVEIPLDFLFGVDFADLFEVRGLKRARRGDFSEPNVTVDRVRFFYRGLDGVPRFTDVVFEPRPVALEAGRASFLITLKPDEQRELEIRVAGGCEEMLKSSRLPARFEKGPGASPIGDCSVRRRMEHDYCEQ
jgi:glycogen debranching enzyme